MVTRHPAKNNAKPPRKPVDGEDGMSGHIYEQRKRLFAERDGPIEERVTSQPNPLVKLRKPGERL